MTATIAAISELKNSRAMRYRTYVAATMASTDGILKTISFEPKSRFVAHNM